MALSVRLVASAAEIPALLWDACFPPPLEGRWWYEALEVSGLEDQFTFGYLIVDIDDRPVALAPIFVMRLPLNIAVSPMLRPMLMRLERLAPAIFAPRTLFIGSPCSDEGTIGILPGVERRAVFASLQRFLQDEARRRRTVMIIWKDFPQSYAGDFAWLSTQYRLFRATSFPGTVVENIGRRPGDYLAGLRSSKRYDLKRKLRQSEAHAALHMEVVQRPNQETLDLIFGLFCQTYEKSETKFERLTHRFFEAIATTPAAHFILLREQASRELVAFMLCLRVGDRVINKYIGIDYRKPEKWFLYFRLWDALVKWASAQGASSIQSGQTGYGAKLGLGHALVPLTNYGQHRSRIIHRLVEAIAKRISWQTFDGDLAVYLTAHPELAERSDEEG